jgi:tetratricopeptide (TPR) repeat protein
MPEYPKLKFKIRKSADEQLGEFIWGSERDVLFKKLGDITQNELTEESIEELENLIEQDPEFINAYVSIGAWELELLNYGNALYYFEKASAAGDAAIPQDFTGKIIWLTRENQAYLKALLGLGLTFLFLREWEEAEEFFSRILKYNPDDDQGVRAFAIENYLAQGKFNEILKLIEMYPDDALPDTLYGAVIAHYRLANLPTAKFARDTAIEFAPEVARQLVEKNHQQFEGDLSQPAEIGSAEEASAYCARMRPYWTDPKLLKFIEDGFK